MDIFVEIMDLIEENTDMPLMEKDIEKWQENSEKNKKVFEIYRIASYARDLD